mmetsp:Transcript_56468/g.101552  ORF Transcript_56468/g.101552 Transcript_56468/m.101552 type:complete len:293 (+) Transcript_56468:37-915(+)
MGACQGQPPTDGDTEVLPTDAPQPHDGPMARIVSEMEEANMSEYDPEAVLCKFACGKKVQPGETKRGNKFDTCCRMCAMNKGSGFHDATCGGRSAPSGPKRKACPSGSQCRDRSDSHLQAFSHPLDEDYAIACSMTKDVEPEPLSLKVLFDWSDADGSGKLSRKELEGSLGKIRACCGDLPEITDEAWSHLDEDGNGVVNFGEFAAWAGPRLGLELGVKKMLGKSASLMMASSPCGVLGCPCETFVGDTDKMHEKKCKDCKHKGSLHVVKASTGEVPYPGYWDNHEGDFNLL